MKIDNFIIEKSMELAKSVDNTAVLLYYGDILALDIVNSDIFKNDIKKIIVVDEDKKGDDEGIIDELKSISNTSVVVVPSISYTRINKIKIALVICISSGILKKDENVVALTGMSNIDTSIFVNISKEKELLSYKGDIKLEESVKPEVFEKILSIALELANQGREGKAVGTIFVLGDSEKVIENTKQMIFNPFKGYKPEERNILLVNLKDTLKEYSLLDGCIIIDSDGVIQAAGAYISTSANIEDIPKGLGTRHIAAASITAVSNAISITVSESTGDVTIFKNGNVITRIEKVI